MKTLIRATPRLVDFISRHLGKSPAPSILFACLALVITAPFAWFDPDLVHDGYMVSVAIAVSEGKVLFNDVFSQYGVITALLQGFAVFLSPLGPMLTIRLVTVLLLALAMFLLVDLGRIAPSAWGLSPTSTFVIGLLWLCSWDVFLGIPLAPWSAMVATTLAVAALYFLALAMNAPVGSKKSIFSAVGAGMALGLLPFTRQSVGVLVLSLLGLFLVITLAKRQALPRAIAIAAISTTISVVGIVLYLATIDALEQFWVQAVLWPLDWASGKDDPLGKFIERFLPWTGGPAILAFLVPLTLREISPVKKMGLVIFFFFGAGFLGGTSGQGFGVGALFPESEAFWWSEFMVNFGYSSLSFLLFYSALNSGLLIVLSAREALTSSQNLWRGPLLISIFAISLLSMSVPVMGTRHFWWALPIALLASSLIATRVHMTRSEISRSLLALPVIAIIAVAGLSGMAFAFLVDREKLPEESSARGMVGRVEIVALAERDLQFVSRIDGNGNTYFIVNSGHLASLTGHYDSADEMFVSWGPQESIDSRLKYPAQIVVDETADHERLVEQLENSGFRTTVDKSNERYLLIFVTK